jgi:CRISPR-associated protein Csx3
MATYLITIETTDRGLLLRGKFGDPAQNDQIVQDADAAMTALLEADMLPGGTLLCINGPMSIPVAFVIAHRVAHLYGAIAVYDPKLGGKYVVSISHDPAYPVGQLLEEI